MAESDLSLASPGWTSSRPPWGTGRVVAATLAVVAVVVLVAAVLWAVFRPADTRLFESIWELESAAVDGSSVETPENPITWQFDRTCAEPGDGPGCWSRDSIAVGGGCGGIETGVRYGGRTVGWTGDAREIAPSCTGPITAAMIAVGGSGSFDYSFDGDRLVVSAPDESAQLVFRSIVKVGWGD